ncbi:hypothetical protein BU23DRAFT_530912 [Bimuria novae-zelandiae CBS 107.79]|uniref:NmrA-like domain-containing protein n=1 Tax=Bimuria novae-zelandiae CBS 107.79 TaxID=1447943 RepID=A0A6A5VJA9_9PLEO|nr:hypothetical protein BU23DRAFT_530912 [Bimuria novae-zelandiae CBS 107.79]
MKGPAGFNIKDKEARIYGTGENPLYWTPLPTIARAAANMLRNPDAIANRGIYICPFPPGAVTQNKLLVVLEAVLDTKFSVTYVDVEKINRNAKIALGRGEFVKTMRGFAVTNQFFEGDCGNNLDGMTENELVGAKEQGLGLEEAIRQAVGRYGADSAVVESMFRIEACEV